MFDPVLGRFLRELVGGANALASVGGGGDVRSVGTVLLVAMVVSGGYTWAKAADPARPAPETPAMTNAPVTMNFLNIASSAS
jgi:hypothetical protein